MIAAMQDLLVLTDEDYDNLPSEGRWEVVDGRAVLLPPNDWDHQDVCDELVAVLRKQLRTLGVGRAVSGVGVRIPPRPQAESKIQSRVPDIAVSRWKPGRYFPIGHPPELVIEVLATRRGNVERTEKLEDYARAGIGEYWVVNPLDRCVEVYRLREGDYVLAATECNRLAPEAFEGVMVELAEIWAVLE